MAKPDREVIIIGEQFEELDVQALARVVLRFARQRQAKLNTSGQSITKPSDGEATP